MIDLSRRGSHLPDLLVVDSNLIIAHFLRSLHTPLPQTAARAAQLFAMLQSSGGIGLITLSCFNEVLHFAVKAQYRAQVPTHRTVLSLAYPNRTRFDWIDLYKIDPGMLQRSVPDLERIRRHLITNDLLFLQPEDLSPLVSRKSRDQELIEVMGRCGLDSSDASMILEAQQVGVFAVASLDPDIQRAAADFDVYTWL